MSWVAIFWASFCWRGSLIQERERLRDLGAFFRRCHTSFRAGRPAEIAIASPGGFGPSKVALDAGVGAVVSRPQTGPTHAGCRAGPESRQLDLSRRTDQTRPEAWKIVSLLPGARRRRARLKTIRNDGDGRGRQGQIFEVPDTAAV
jgi:hypothetical protein